MSEEKKWSNVSVGFVMDLQRILDYLVENEVYQAEIGNIKLKYNGTLEDTANGKRQVFEIIRKIRW